MVEMRLIFILLTLFYKFYKCELRKYIHLYIIITYTSVNFSLSQKYVSQKKQVNLATHIDQLKIQFSDQY